MPTQKPQKPVAKSHRSTLSLQKTEIVIHVYDLLPPGRVSSTLWFLGTSLLHSGVVINGKEYAYGGHDRRGVTGVYWTKPRTEPPGGTFKCEILHGFTLSPQSEIDTIVRDASEEFLGTSYNLLTKNCNHFTSHLCLKLTGRPGPGWLNRAASIGVALPCVVPRDWIEPPEFDTADGELLDEDEDEHDRADERSRMLRSSSEQPRLVDQTKKGRRDSASGSGSAADELNWDSEDERRSGGSGKGKGKAPSVARDAAGRILPASERAPAQSRA
ncbi:PPPDE putative peptidase domain-containing protein [Podospora didyma]|uniref:PPPDE putative peptidase domain-containing protein n=1 Tax=Podospora didyma TaxID=330526 RepID=A0AAE0U8F9_9PEZI|nr:PPPDE putative peptidase domain-containing protein [Podospora didyma]